MFWVSFNGFAGDTGDFTFDFTNVENYSSEVPEAE
jgi:hypothetical protein